MGSAPANGLRLDVVGAGPAYTDRPGATGASYLVRAGGTSVLLDLGQGSFPRLAGLIDPRRLTAIVVSHLHPDHYIDLVALRHYLRWEFEPVPRVRVVGPAGLADRLDALHREPGWTAASLDVETLQPGTLTLGDLVVEAARVTHTDDSFGLRVSVGSGPGLVYSGDCGRADDLDVLIHPGDTILAEASFGPGPIIDGAQHLDGPAVGRLASRTGAGRVLLTHIQMGYDDDATVAATGLEYAGPVTVVAPGDRIDLNTSRPDTPRGVSGRGREDSE